ncbi:MAG: beta-ketoacyl-[acyl-carrier-protein] synthase family protein [Lentisphaerae bacterium]|nr:beta-ketoacyl-[acyl-carrier-protein] synthase family protein [Lentisphaerota bacterium]
MKVAVTGMGIVSPIGQTVPDFWDALCNGISGIKEISRFSKDGFAFVRGGEIADFVPNHDFGAHAPISSAASFMMAAASQAIEDARLCEDCDANDVTGVVMSTNFGDTDAAEQLIASLAKHGAIDKHTLPRYLFQSMADRIADRWRLHGPRSVLSLSCSSGTAALGYGANLIRSGRAKVVITGGYDALSKFAWSGLSVLRTMTNGEIRPFDKRRDGTVFSEGAGSIVLEDYNHARARGSHIYAVLSGYGLNNNAHHMTAPSKNGAGSTDVMRMAIEDAGIAPSEIDHVNAHATGTKYNDITETQAIKAVLGKHAYEIPIAANKSEVGHMMGAAGIVEAIASVMSIVHGVVPPTINYGEPDPECDLDCVPNTKRAVPLRTVLSNSAGIGGCNAAIVLTASDTNTSEDRKEA